MDHYDKTKSRLGNSLLIEPTALAHATGVAEYPDCASDMYLDYVITPTIEIINAIEGANITRDGADRSQLSQTIKAEVAAGAGFLPDLSTLATGTASGGFTNLSIGTPLGGRKSIHMRIVLANDTGGIAHKLEIKDTDGTIFEVVRNDRNNAGGGGQALAPPVTPIFKINGVANLLQFKVTQTRGASDVGMNFIIERWGWI